MLRLYCTTEKTEELRGNGLREEKEAKECLGLGKPESGNGNELWVGTGPAGVSQGMNSQCGHGDTGTDRHTDTQTLSRATKDLAQCLKLPSTDPCTPFCSLRHAHKIFQNFKTSFNCPVCLYRNFGPGLAEQCPQAQLELWDEAPLHKHTCSHKI